MSATLVQKIKKPPILAASLNSLIRVTPLAVNETAQEKPVFIGFVAALQDPPTTAIYDLLLSDRYPRTRIDLWRRRHVSLSMAS